MNDEIQDSGEETQDPATAEQPGSVQVAVVAQGGAAELAKLGAVLQAADVPHDIVSPADCGADKCGPGLMLVTPPDSMAAARAAIEAHWDSELPESERHAAAEVVDFDAEKATCPACMTPFTTADATRCPECGLNFGE